MIVSGALPDVTTLAIPWQTLAASRWSPSLAGIAAAVLPARRRLHGSTSWRPCVRVGRCQLGLDPVEAEIGTVDAATTVPQQNAWLNRFFDRQIKG